MAPFGLSHGQGLSPNAYGKPYRFQYNGYFEGDSFNSADGTEFTPVNSNVMSLARIKETPHKNPKSITDKFGFMKYYGYFLIFDNGYGTDLVRIVFSTEKDAENYKKALNKQFLH